MSGSATASCVEPALQDRYSRGLVHYSALLAALHPTLPQLPGRDHGGEPLIGELDGHVDGGLQRDGERPRRFRGSTLPPGQRAWQPDHDADDLVLSDQVGDRPQICAVLDIARDGDQRRCQYTGRIGDGDAYAHCTDVDPEQSTSHSATVIRGVRSGGP